MTENRAVLLGFAGMALVLMLGPTFLAWNFVRAVDGAPPDAAEAQAVNQVFDAKTKTFDEVRGIERVLPVGMAWSAAEKALMSSKFSCKASAAGKTCYRETQRGPCRLDRRIEVGLADDMRISSIAATETPNCL